MDKLTIAQTNINSMESGNNNHTIGNTRWFASTSASPAPCSTSYLPTRASRPGNVPNGSVDRLRSSNNHLESTVEELKLEIAFYKGEIQRLEVEKDTLKEDVDRVSNLFDNWVVEASGQAYKDVIGSNNSGTSSNKSNSPSRESSSNSPSVSNSGRENGSSSSTNSHENSMSNSNSNSSKQQELITQSAKLDNILAVEEKYQNRRNAASTSASQGISYIKEMVRYPCQSISDALGLRDDQRIWLVTSCQSPYYIEYVSKAWCDFCGWTSSEALGMTCGLLQGPATDRSRIQYFMRDVKELGYGKMNVCNYKKNGDTFQVEVIVYPIFDSPVNTGKDSDLPVLTHYASIMIPSLQKENFSQVRINMNQDVGFKNEEDNFLLCECPKKNHSGESESLVNHQRRRFDAKCILSSETFFRFGHTLRLSNLLRLMLSCRSAMLLADRQGRVVHVNQEFTEFSNCQLSDIEGLSITELLITDPKYIDGLKEVLSNGSSRCFQNVKFQPGNIETTQENDSSSIETVSVFVVPIYGGYQRTDVSHFALLFSPVVADAAIPSLETSNSSSRSKSRSSRSNTTGISSTSSDSGKSGCDQMECGQGAERSIGDGSSNASEQSSGNVQIDSVNIVEIMEIANSSSTHKHDRSEMDHMEERVGEGRNCDGVDALQYHAKRFKAEHDNKI